MKTINILSAKFAIILLLILSCCCYDVLGQDDPFAELKYRNLGPFRGGRVTAVHGVDAYANVFYMGATGGGMWKSEDYGQSWENISDGYFDTPSIGAINVSSSNPELIFVGTGSDGLRSNVISGKGIYKSTDGGASWEFSGLPNAGQIGAVEIHPENDDVVFAAVIGQAFKANEERGIYKTIDGAKTWVQVYAISDTTGFVDLEFHPTNPNMIYAAAWRAERKPWTIISGGKENGIYRSSDGGSAWKKIGKGLPERMGKIDLAVSIDQPDRLYALVEAVDTLRGLYMSDDRGENFTFQSSKKGLTDRPFYYCNVEADRHNADKVYVNSTRFYRSADAGKSWSTVSTPHGDNHDIWINPIDSNLIVQSNDGGANVSFNGGKTWSTQYNQNTAELYQVEVDNQYPYWLYAGQQDNYTTISVPSMAPHSHQLGSAGYVMNTGGCETGPAVPNPLDPNIVYSNCKGKFSVYNKTTGQEKRYDVEGYFMYGHSTEELPQRFQRVSPIHVSPHDPSVIYHCSQYVNKTTDEGLNWEKISPDLTAFEADKQMRSGGPFTNDITGEEFYSTIYSIQESPLEKGVIYVGANDGPVHVSKDGGKNWKRVSKDLPKGGRIDSVEPSKHQKGVAYITMLRYQLGDEKPYIYRTENYGESWELITKGIPSHFPVRVVREDAKDENLLFAGTEYGVFVSLNRGKTWKTFQQNLPVTPITDIKIHRGDLVLSTMGRGFWILDDVAILRQGYQVRSETKLYKPQDGIRYRYSRTSSTGSIMPSHRYPQPGVIIDYYLHDTVGEIKLDIYTDNKRTLIRSFTNFSETQDTIIRDMMTNYTESSLNSALSVNKGAHRFKWDMKMKGAWRDNEKNTYSRGALAAPGEYRIILTVVGKEYEQEFFLLRDPRVSEEDVTDLDLMVQEGMLKAVIDLQSNVRKTTALIKERLKEDPDDKKMLKALEFLEQKDGRYTKPMFAEQLNYLYGIMNKADQKLGQDVYDRYVKLQKQYIDYCRQYKFKYDNAKVE